ncbi:MAG: translation initiation factor 1 [Thermoplasmata archaeon]|jgi:translation initiation factor 1|nr:translation initiation factor 1 [Thermoplasmata archaeon]
MRKDLEEALGLEDALAIDSSLVNVRLDTRRYGKSVTVLDGFDPTVDIAMLGKQLKQAMGTGGTVRDGTIELQGDHRREVREYLEKAGYKLS